MFVQEHISLLPYNTFRIDVKSKYFACFNSLDELLELIQSDIYKNNKSLILGGGSNILLCQDFDGLVLKNEIHGISMLREDTENVWIKAHAGESWHDFVLYCLDHNYGGIENLSLIPGSIGAAPMQNIGAYGVELQDVVDEVSAIEIATCSLKHFSKEQCKFGYRESIFKNTHKDQFIIVSVVFKLSKHPILNISYGAIQEQLQKSNISNPTIRDVSNAVIAIRSSKLPNPAVLGNAGSFFKNPELSAAAFEIFHQANPTAPHYVLTDKRVKVPAGWLIEQCGWKGKVVGHTGAHKDQALVLVNYGSATGHEIYALAMAIQQSVKEQFNIDIHPEVNIY